MSPVFYRKWRPQTFAEVAGQQLVTQTLLNALKSGRISHAYLFCGTRGTGKTSTGRILAKAVNCLADGKGEPCNACDMCQAITESRALDVIEIDAASNRKIDDVRELRERVNYAPSQARYKVYIIDEVHGLSTDASNALLKTLEEPPPRVIFVLATTEVHKILPTLLSRCQRFDFKRLSRTDVIGKLGQICQAEGISIEPEGLRLIARSATGSLRDAENLLEQLTTYFGSRVELHQVQSVLGVTSDSRVKELVTHIVDNNLTAGMATITGLNGEGFDPKQFNRQMVEYLRGLLLVKSGSGDALDVTADDMEGLKTLAARATLPQVLRAVKQFGQIEIGSDSYSTLPLELALVDCILPAVEDKAPAGAPPARVPSPPKPVQKPSPPPQAHVPAKPPPAVKPREESPAEHPTAAKPPAPVPPAEARPEAPPETAITPQLGTELERLESSWRQILGNAPPSARKTTTLAFLRSVRPMAIENDVVILAAKHDFFIEQLEKPENQKVAVEIIANFLGHPCKVRCVHRPENNHLVRAALRMGAQITGEEKK